MKKILDKVITYFFVGILGILWYCSTRYHIKPNHHIVIYDVFGKQTEIDGIRTSFKNYRVAQSYILEYQKGFPHYHFSMTLEIPEIKERKILRSFKIQR